MMTFAIAAMLVGTSMFVSPAPRLKASMIVLGVHDLSRSVKFLQRYRFVAAGTCTWRSADVSPLVI
jgi:hypothetical protein